ncbi:TIGR00341 family protein [Methanocaldococcus sp. 10A]
MRINPRIYRVEDYSIGFIKALKSIKTIIIELVFVIVLSMIAGHYLPISLDNPQIHSRITLDFWNIVIALSAGIAGSLSTISNVSSTVVGVMIAIALLPPLAVFGLLIGAGYITESFLALILFLINMIAINLSAIVIFSAYGISPYRWWEKEKAKKYTLYAILLWVMLFITVFVLIIYH